MNYDDLNLQNRMKRVYDEALKFLYNNKPSDVSDEQLEELFIVPKENFNTKNKILKRLFSSLQNYQSMNNDIGFDTKEDRKKIFKKILFDFDDAKILKRYKTYNDLLEVFIREFDLDRSRFKRENNQWTKYSKAVLSASSFMSRFKDASDFHRFIMRFKYNDMTAAALPMLLSKEIYGLGFAIGCDFLKEIGYDQYPKPDVHLMDVFSELDLSERNEYSCYKAIIRMANCVEETPFKVDKVLWLICSGKYGDVEIDGKKKNFIAYVKAKNVL